MKTAISVPDDTFVRVEEMRQRLGLSRSEFYATAARRWLSELEAEGVTAAIDAALEGVDADAEGAFARAAARALPRTSDDAW